MVTAKTDILVKDPNGAPIAVIEVKSRENLSRYIAAALRRNMIAHGLLTDVKYFLLVSQDKGFLWKNGGQAPIDSPPTYEFSMSEVVRKYLAKMQSKERLKEAQLELLVFQWLNDLLESERKPRKEPGTTLARSGFLDALKGGQITVEA